MNDGQAHPLRVHVILDMALRHLGVPDLKNCRVVCKFWDNRVTPLLLNKTSVIINLYQTEQMTEIQRWMESKEWVVSKNKKVPSKRVTFFVNIKCIGITRSAYPHITTVLGPRIRSFTNMNWWGDHRDMSLDQYHDLLVNKCPNLEELKVAITKAFTSPHGSNFLTFAEDPKNQRKLHLKSFIGQGEVKPDLRFWRMLIISPELKSFTITCKINESFWSPTQKYIPNVIKVENLEIRSYANESISCYSSRFFLARKWTNMKSLTYECYTLSDKIMQLCSEHVASTLINLNTVLFNKVYKPWPQWKGKNWLIPPVMTKLESVTLEVDDHCEGPIFCRTLVAAILLKSLKFLRMRIYDNSNSRAEDWPNGLFARMIKGTMEFDSNSDADAVLVKNATETSSTTSRPSTAMGTIEAMPKIDRPLKLLQLPPKFQDLSCIQNLLHYFPNLTELILAFPTVAVLRKVMQDMQSLERLTITLPENNNISWTNVLTKEAYICGNVKYTGSLVDLQNLQFLEILFSPRESVGSDSRRNKEESGSKMALSDDLVYNGLINLPNLQHIVIEEHRFSDEAVDTLRKNVLPFCFIEI